jgi:hypothetical protein
MASDTQPSVFKIALVGWRGALRAIADMMPVAGAAFLFTIFAEAALQLLHSHSLAIEFAILPLYWVTQSLVLTPLAIAVHRYVLLEDVTQHYALDRSDQRFQRYFGFAVAVQALWLSLWALWIMQFSSSARRCRASRFRPGLETIWVGSSSLVSPYLWSHASSSQG